MDDFDDQTDVGDGDAGAPAPAPQISGGLLDSKTFPGPVTSAVADGPVVNAQDPLITNPLKVDPHSEVLQDILNAQANLPSLDPAGDPTGGEWVERSLPSIRRPLDTDTHAEVLKDILGAQAKLPPVGPRYSIMQSEGFDPTRFTDVTAMPSPDVFAAGIAGAPTVAVTDGGPEKATYMIPFPLPPNSADTDPATGLVSKLRTKPIVFMPSSGGATAGAGAGFDTARLPPPPANALAVEHGHRDGYSDGFVDAPTPKYPFGDTQSLSPPDPIPTATVSDGLLAWHGIDHGRLKFIYPEGSMTPDQVEKQQRNLNDEQKLFLRPK